MQAWVHSTAPGWAPAAPLLCSVSVLGESTRAWPVPTHMLPSAGDTAGPGDAGHGWPRQSSVPCSTSTGQDRHQAAAGIGTPQTHGGIGTTHKQPRDSARDFDSCGRGSGGGGTGLHRGGCATCRIRMGKQRGCIRHPCPGTAPEASGQQPPAGQSIIRCTQGMDRLCQQLSEA